MEDNIKRLNTAQADLVALGEGLAVTTANLVIVQPKFDKKCAVIAKAARMIMALGHNC